MFCPGGSEACGLRGDDYRAVASRFLGHGKVKYVAFNSSSETVLDGSYVRYSQLLTHLPMSDPSSDLIYGES
jgi:hypothetical protein